ncbi:hypothetical protein Tco_1350804 [Tanacetum coccineum]
MFIRMSRYYAIVVSLDVQRYESILLSLYIRCSTELSRLCYRCTLMFNGWGYEVDYAIVVFRMFNRGEERVRLLVGSPGASTTPIHSPGSSSTPIYSPGASTTPIYSPGSSSTLIYSPGALRNAECSNCKHLLDKITVLEAMLEMYKNPEQHTLNSAALLHEVYNDMGKLDLE